MMYTISIPSNIQALEGLSTWLSNTLPNTLSKTMKNNMLLVTQELATNAILHGNQEIESKRVSVTVEITATFIGIFITDEGIGGIALPTKEESMIMDNLDENGRGLKLAVLLSDRIELNKNEIRIYFKL